MKTSNDNAPKPKSRKVVWKAKTANWPKTLSRQTSPEPMPTPNAAERRQTSKRRMRDCRMPNVSRSSSKDEFSDWSKVVIFNRRDDLHFEHRFMAIFCGPICNRRFKIVFKLMIFVIFFTCLNSIFQSMSKSTQHMKKPKLPCPSTRKKLQTWKRCLPIRMQLNTKKTRQSCDCSPNCVNWKKIELRWRNSSKRPNPLAKVNYLFHELQCHRFFRHAAAIEHAEQPHWRAAKAHRRN